VAVCLLFSYANPEHERAMAAALQGALGRDVPVSLSHEVAAQYGEYERTSTTVLNAYVMPVVGAYIGAL
jgi:N-methylhydantoinase A